RLAGRSLGLDSAWGVAAIMGLSVAVIATLAALRCRQWAAEKVRVESGFDVFFGPYRSERINARTIEALGRTVVLALVLVATTRTDWDFLILKLGILTVWIVTFAQIYRLSPGTVPASARPMMLVCAVPLLLYYLDPSIESAIPRWLANQGLSVRHTLDRYTV